MKMQISNTRSLAVAACSALLLGLFPFVSAQADQTGGILAGSAGTLPLAGSDSVWANTVNVTTLPGVANGPLLNANDTTNYLYGSNFGFAIPDGSAIDGIELLLIKQWQCSAGVCANDTITDAEVRIVNADATVGSENKATATPWPRHPASETETYGGATDLWSETWTAADINDPDFGVVVAAQTSDTSNKQGFVWFLVLDISFTLPATTTNISCDSPVDPGDDSNCTAMVTPSAGGNTASGDITWTSGDGTFSSPTCTLVAGECMVVFTPDGVSESPAIAADFAGDANMSASSGNFTIRISQPQPVPVFGPVGLMLTILGMGLLGGWQTRRRKS